MRRDMSVGAALAAPIAELANRVAASRRHCVNARALVGNGLAAPNLDSAIVLLEGLLADLETAEQHYRDLAVLDRIHEQQLEQEQQHGRAA